MGSESGTNGTLFNRGTGLLVIEVRYSNPNGDPDAESEPRTIDGDGRGLISPVSFKRKLRDLVADKDGPAWERACDALGLCGTQDLRTIKVNTRRGLDHATQAEEFGPKYHVLETRFRERDKIKAMKPRDFAAEFWDARVFGNTFLESLKEEGDANPDKSEKARSKKDKQARLKELEERSHFISTGVVQFGPGISLAPVSIVRNTWTSKSGVEADKDRGLAPLSWRVVEHAVYVMPYFVNPCMATKTGCGWNDVQLMQLLIPHAYPLNPSVARTFVEVRHAWYAEHQSPLGSCPDSLIIDALTPKKAKGKPDEPSTSIEDYGIPSELALPKAVRDRLANFVDLCVKQWGKP